jgi:prefoldin subunit 5
MKLNQKIEQLLNFVRSDNGVALFTLFALSVMIYHTGVAFYVESGKSGYISGFFASLFALAIDAAILIFVLRGNQMAHVFSVFQIVMNLIHFGEIQNTDWYNVSFGAWFISFSLPVIISSYSHEVKKGKKEQALKEKEHENQLQLQDVFDELAELQAVINTVQADVNNLSLNISESEESKNKINDLENRITELQQVVLNPSSELQEIKEEVAFIRKKTMAAVETLLRFKNNSDKKNLYSPNLNYE